MVMLTSRLILPFAFWPVTRQVYFVSEKVRVGMETIGLVDLEIENGAVHWI